MYFPMNFAKIYRTPPVKKFNFSKVTGLQPANLTITTYFNWNSRFVEDLPVADSK